MRVRLLAVLLGIVAAAAACKSPIEGILQKEGDRTLLMGPGYELRFPPGWTVQRYQEGKGLSWTGTPSQGASAATFYALDTWPAYTPERATPFLLKMYQHKKITYKCGKGPLPNGAYAAFCGGGVEGEGAFGIKAVLRGRHMYVSHIVTAENDLAHKKMLSAWLDSLELSQLDPDEL